MRKELIRYFNGNEYSLAIKRTNSNATAIGYFKHIGSTKKMQGMLTRDFGDLLKSNEAYFIRSGYLNVPVDKMIKSGALVSLGKRKEAEDEMSYELFRMNEKMVSHVSNLSNEKALIILGYESNEEETD